MPDGVYQERAKQIRDVFSEAFSPEEFRINKVGEPADDEEERDDRQISFDGAIETTSGCNGEREEGGEEREANLGIGEDRMCS